MSDPLLIPASPALLDGWVGPVLVDDGSGDLLPCVHLGVAHEWEGWVALGELGTRPGQPVVDALQRPISDVFLDLRRAEVRDRCARVVAPLVFDDLDAEDVILSACGGPGQFAVSPMFGMGISICTVKVGDRWRGREECDHLDPMDDTRLPDGSRRVDALALAAVVRQVVCDV
jgi:hypothetical protein